MDIINSVSSTIQNTFVEAEKKTKIWLVANRAFLELAASFAFNLTLIRFFAVPTVVPEAIRHFLAGCTLQAGYRLFYPDSGGTEPGQHAARTSAAFFIGRAGLQSAIHESGHALMALACFKRATPHITIVPFKNCMTDYAISYGTTAFGSVLGRQAALVLIAASGIMATTATVMLALAVAGQLKKNYPFAAKRLTYQAAGHLLIDLTYGFRAFYDSRSNLTNDFIYMWQYGGIHPLVPICLMVALPIITYEISQGSTLKTVFL